LIGFAGSTFGSMLADHAAMRRRTRAEIAVDVLPHLRAWPPSLRSAPLQRLTTVGWLLGRRERRCIQRLDLAWYAIDQTMPWIVDTNDGVLQSPADHLRAAYDEAVDAVCVLIRHRLRAPW
jgi:hypothetical protein